ncbi:MAG TPA: histidine kinase [Geodermatophilus sp.]|nr:histidine kinase [Geodermatophilus sp.]
METTSGRRELRRDAVPVLVLAVLTTGALLRLRDGDATVTQVATSLLLWAPALVRRRRPLLAFAVTALLVAAHWAPSGFDAVTLLPADLALLVVLAAVTERCSTAWAVVATAVCELFALATLLGTAAPVGAHPIAPLTAFTLVAAVTGRNRRAQATVLAGLRERAERAELERDQQARIAVAEERTRIAREVHDVVSHNVSVMTALADGAGYALRSDTNQPARDAVAAIASTGRAALAELHGLLGVLRSDDDHGDDDSRRPAPGLADLATLVDRVRAAGLPTTLTVVGRPTPLGTAAQLAVYRLVQEALTNTRKHARGASRAGVALTWTAGGLEVVIQDDGCGDAASPDHVGHGLVGMRERISAHGGSVSAGPAPAGGWRVAASLPLAAAATRW